MLREKSCGALVVRRDEEDGKQYLLMIRHKLGGHRSFPKGHMEKGETRVIEIKADKPFATDDISVK